jgi:hypothetical protein
LKPSTQTPAPSTYQPSHASRGTLAKSVTSALSVPPPQRTPLQTLKQTPLQQPKRTPIQSLQRNTPVLLQAPASQKTQIASQISQNTSQVVNSSANNNTPTASATASAIVSGLANLNKEDLIHICSNLLSMTQENISNNDEKSAVSSPLNQSSQSRTQSQMRPQSATRPESQVFSQNQSQQLNK